MKLLNTEYNAIIWFHNWEVERWLSIMKKRQKRVALRKINASLNSSMLATANTKPRANITAVIETPLGDPGVDRKNALSALSMSLGRKCPNPAVYAALFCRPIPCSQTRLQILKRLLVSLNRCRQLFSKYEPF